MPAGVAGIRDREDFVAEWATVPGRAHLTSTLAIALAIALARRCRPRRRFEMAKTGRKRRARRKKSANHGKRPNA